jgi:hypothetical protein
VIAYTVRCTFDDENVAEEWIAWLREEHLADVRAGGAIDATVVRLDRDEGALLTCEVRYHFASREMLATYEREHAPRLRAEGLAKFPLERGLAYSRSVGEIVCPDV